MMEILIAREGGREAIARLLSQKLGPDARIVHDADGAPLLVGARGHVSVSHSRHFAALAFDPDVRIGIDIEEPRLEQLRRVVGKFLNPDELDAWGHRLLAAWTCKEAAFKAAGIAGIALPSIALTPEGHARTPDGRLFALTTIELPEFTLSTARPL